MKDGKVFARPCPGCGKRHMTADQSGATKCDACLADKPAEPSQGALAPAPAPGQPILPPPPAEIEAEVHEHEDEA